VTELIPVFSVVKHRARGIAIVSGDHREHIGLLLQRRLNAIQYSGIASEARVSSEGGLGALEIVRMTLCDISSVCCILSVFWAKDLSSVGVSGNGTGEPVMQQNESPGHFLETCLGL
jgi:hypothetical protein